DDGAHGLPVLHGKPVRIAREDDARAAREERRRLLDQPRVPVRVEVHVRVDLQEPVLAGIESHRHGPGPAGTACIHRIDAQVGDPPRPAEGRARRRGALVDDAEVQRLRMLRGGRRPLEREAEHRVAVRSDAHEDAHAATLSGTSAHPLLVRQSAGHAEPARIPGTGHSRGDTMNRKGFLSLFAGTLAAAAFALPAGAQQAITLHGASQFNDDHAFTKALVRFEELVKKYYGKPVNFVLHKNSELGLEKDYFAYMNQGKAVDYG